MTICTVVPARDAAGWIADALTSVLAQSRPADQMIVVDNGSADDTADIARAHGATVIAQPDGGVTAAFNAGIAAAACDSIAFLGSDDLWDVNHLQNLETMLALEPSAAVAFSAMRLTRLGSDQEYARWMPPPFAGTARDASQYCASRVAVPGSACLVRRDLLRQACGSSPFRNFSPESQVAPDYGVWLRLSLAFPFVWAHNVTATYRRHPASIGATRMLEQRLAVKAAQRAVLAELHGDPRQTILERSLWP